ncbi:MAG: site-specific integrase [Syntrophobacteria bacterium]
MRYWIDYKLPGGKQKRELVGKSIEKARDADGKRKAQKREGRLDEIFAYKKESTWTFEELAKWWLKLGSVKSRSDHSRVEIAFNKFNKVFGRRLIRVVKLSELKDYQSQRRSEGQADSTTDHETHSAAKAAMRAIWLDNEITAETWKTWENFKKLISGKKAQKKYARNRVLETEEYCRLNTHLPYHLKVLLDINLFTGMRKSELVPDTTNGEGKAGLLWSQVDYKNRMIRLTDTKTGIPRDIPMTDELRGMLKAIPRTLGVDNVFTYRGKPFSDVRTGLIKTCEKAGIAYGKKVEGGFVFGDLRRTAKTLMARAGIDKAYRDAILGHESQDMDRHYLHPDFEKDLRAAMDKYHAWLREQIEAEQERSSVTNGSAS